MDGTPVSQSVPLTQSTPLTNTPSTPSSLPSRSLPRSSTKNLLNSSPWSHLFRPSPLGTYTIPSTQSQPPVSQPHDPSQPSDSTTFIFCQNRLLASTQDLTKMIQTASSTLTTDKSNIESLISDARGLISSVREENIAHHNQNMKNSSLVFVLM
jgi:hypothetical protein